MKLWVIFTLILFWLTFIASAQGLETMQEGEKPERPQSLLCLDLGRKEDNPGKPQGSPKSMSCTGENMKTLKIRWQRLVTDGQTCPRCGATEGEVEKAFRSLEQSLSTLGIKMVLEKLELDPGTFRRDPFKSNRIWINGRLLEEWLDLKVGQSPCCEPCGDAQCRTIEAPGQVYETIPADLIIKAGLLAAAQIVEVKKGEPCCPGQVSVGTIPCSNNCRPK